MWGDSNCCWSVIKLSNSFGNSDIIWRVVGGAVIIKWGVSWGYLRRSVGGCMLAMVLYRLERGF